MSHEIYYTSAPEGIKRGSHGFCTVGTTDAIPKPLWERLEALSGYRNHFEAGRGRNPVLHAHWLVTLAGREYHVLSRVCDSGSDYTQRTNAFAHHVALESSELPPAGPAWLIDQPNVMAAAWNGQIGSIIRPAPLPWADEAPAICRAWQHTTGDPGWAGVLAEAFTKSHTRPVCLLFNPDQDMLPLIAEAIRLLPPRVRWGVTFNTYFTSMPASAVCLWRCCLAGTPAAAAGMRYAAAGVVLNLAEPSRLGTPANSPWVQMARTGIPMTVASPASSAAAARPALVAPPVMPPAVTIARPTYDAPPPPAPAPIPDRVPLPAAAETPLDLGPPPEPYVDARVAIDRQPTIVPDRSPTRLVRHGGMMQTAPPSISETIAAQQREQRRMKFAVVAVLALFAVAAGTWLLVLSRSRELPPEPLPPPHDVSVHPAPPANGGPLEGYTPTPPATRDTALPPPPSPPVVPLTPTPILPPAPNPTNTAVLPPPPPAAPRLITLGTAIDMRATASGLRDRVQTISIPPTDFDDLKGVASLSLAFPRDRQEYIYKNGEISGTLDTVADNHVGEAGFIVRWKDHLRPAGPVEVLAVALDKDSSQLTLTWRANVLQRRPEVASLTYWLLQNSTLVAADAAHARPQRIVMKPLDLPPVSFVSSTARLNLPADLPALTAATIRTAPAGWQADWFVDWDSQDPRQRTPAKAIQVIRLRKPTSVTAIDAAFILTFRPGWTTVVSNFANRSESDQAELARTVTESAGASAEIARLQDLAKPDLDAWQQELTAKLALVGLSDADLARQNLTPHALQLQIDELRGNIDQRTAKLSDDLTPLKAKLADNEQLQHAYRAAVTSYAELTDFTVTLELPDGTPIATIPFQRRAR